MAQYIPKEPLVAKIERLRKNAWESFQKGNSTEEQYYIRYGVIQDILFFLEDEVKDLYEQCIQYDSIKAGIQAHAKTYSFNIESKLFNQLTKEQQKLWRKEMEQACISGGEVGVELARDIRYKENIEVKEDNLLTEKKIEKELTEAYINIFDKKFGNKLPNLKSKQLAEFKNFINTCKQTFHMKYFDYHAMQGKLFEKLALLWAVWGKEHLTLEMEEVNLEKEYEEFVVNDPVYNKLVNGIVGKAIAKYFYSLGLKA